VPIAAVADWSGLIELLVLPCRGRASQPIERSHLTIGDQGLEPERLPSEPEAKDIEMMSPCGAAARLFDRPTRL
jgi:hypothetical protein